MRSQPTETEAEIASYSRHAADVRRRAVQLRAEAAQARKHAAGAIRSLELRQAAWREEAEFRAEEKRGMRELSACIDALRREQEMLRDETALQDQWFREQVLEMLEQGWTPDELREVGFSDAFMAELGLADHSAPEPAVGSKQSASSGGDAAREQ